MRLCVSWDSLVVVVVVIGDRECLDMVVVALWSLWLPCCCWSAGRAVRGQAAGRCRSTEFSLMLIVDVVEVGVVEVVVVLVGWLY